MLTKTTIHQVYLVQSKTVESDVGNKEEKKFLKKIWRLVKFYKQVTLTNALVLSKIVKKSVFCFDETEIV